MKKAYLLVPLAAAGGANTQVTQADIQAALKSPQAVVQVANQPKPTFLDNLVVGGEAGFGSTDYKVESGTFSGDGVTRHYTPEDIAAINGNSRVSQDRREFLASIGYKLPGSLRIDGLVGLDDGNVESTSRGATAKADNTATRFGGRVVAGPYVIKDGLFVEGEIGYLAGEHTGNFNGEVPTTMKSKGSDLWAKAGVGNTIGKKARVSGGVLYHDADQTLNFNSPSIATETNTKWSNPDKFGAYGSLAYQLHPNIVLMLEGRKTGSSDYVGLSAAIPLGKTK